MRLQRALARAGVASRRAAEELIRGSQVQVNGAVAQLGMSVDPETDVITVRGRRIQAPRTTWIALNKPIGYVVTRHDPEGRRTVFELLPDVPGLTYVGRLDVMTTGLLLLTNDGGLAHRLMHPRFEVERTYRVLVHGRREEEIRSAFARGIVIDERPVNVVSMKLRPSEESRGSFEMLLVLREGRYRIVRRIAEQLGLKVERLTRLTYGPVLLGDLAPGTWRYLEESEIAAIAAGRTHGTAARRETAGGSARRRVAQTTEKSASATNKPGGSVGRRAGAPGKRADKRMSGQADKRSRGTRRRASGKSGSAHPPTRSSAQRNKGRRKSRRRE